MESRKSSPDVRRGSGADDTTPEQDKELIAEQNLKALDKLRRTVTQSARLSKFLDLIDLVLDPPVAADGAFAPLLRIATLLIVLFFLLVLGWLFGVFLTWGTLLVVALVHLSAKSVRSDQQFYKHLYELIANEASERTDDKQACEWMNYVTEKFWGSVVEEIVLGIVPVIHKQLDALDALKMLGMKIKIREIHLGRTPPRNLYMQVERTQRYDSIILKTETVFASSDMRIVMDVQTPAINMPVLVTNYKFQAPVRIAIDLNPDDLMASLVSVSLVRDPQFSVPTVRPLKGLNVMMIPGLPQIVQGIVKDVCREMFVYPQMFRMTFGAQIVEGPSLSDTPITDIAVITPKEIRKGQLPEGWTILQRSSSLQYKADLNSGAPASVGEIYLAYKRSAHEQPITDIAVTFPQDDEDLCPSDYVSCERSVSGEHTGNMNRHNGRKCFLAYKKDPIAPPITDISIVIKPKDHEQVLPGFRRCYYSVNGRNKANLNTDGSGDRPYITYKGGRDPDRHTHEIAIGDVNLIFLDKKEVAPLSFGTIFRTVSGNFPADTNKGAGGRAIHICYRRADIIKDETALTDVQLIATRGNEESRAPSGYELVGSRPSGGIADLNSGTGGPVLQFAVKREYTKNIVEQSLRTGGRAAGDDLAVVTGLAVINASSDTESVPDGYELVPTGLNEGNKKGRKMLLAVRKTSLHKLIEPYLKLRAKQAEAAAAAAGGPDAEAGTSAAAAAAAFHPATQGSVDAADGDEGDDELGLIAAVPAAAAAPHAPARRQSAAAAAEADAALERASFSSDTAPVVEVEPEKAAVTAIGCYVPGQEELPDGWEVVRHTVAQGHPANCNAGSGGEPVYVAVRRDVDAPPVTHVAVLFRHRAKTLRKPGKSGEVVPDGWREVATSVSGKHSGDFNKGSGGRDVYLAYRVGADAPPVWDVGVLFRNHGEQAPAHMRVVERTLSASCVADLNAESGKGPLKGKGCNVFLCYAGGSEPMRLPGTWREV